MSSKNFGSNMILITSYWGDSKSFKLIPANTECPFLEAMFDSTTGLLAVIGKNVKQIFHMVHKVDENGDMVMLKSGKRENGKPFKEERRTIDTFHEYYIIEESEIILFIKAYAINAEEFDYMKHVVASRSIVSAKNSAPIDTPSMADIMKKVK